MVEAKMLHKMENLMVSLSNHRRIYSILRQAQDEGVARYGVVTLFDMQNIFNFLQTKLSGEIGGNGY